jgi:hypothetical protein
LTGVTCSLSGAMQFTFTNAPGSHFTVLTTTNLALPLNSWTVMTNPVVESPAGCYQFNGPSATNETQRFYRVCSP